MKFKSLSIFAVAASLVVFISCGGNKEKSEEKEVEKTASSVQPQTVEVSIFPSMPVKGERADYFSLILPEGQTAIKLTGEPDEEYDSRGVIKATVDIKVLKPFKDKLYSFGGYNGLTLHLLDEDKEDLGNLSMGTTDMELLEAELGKSSPGVVSVVFKDKVYDSNYNKILSKAKYVRLEDADFEGEKEHEKKLKASESASAASASTDSSDDSESSVEIDKERIKEKTKEVKEKAKEKGRELKEKALDKINDWLD